MIFALYVGLIFLSPLSDADDAVPDFVEFSDPAEEAARANSKNENAPATLALKNREWIHGELLDASATEFSWRSPLFDEPLRLRWDAVLQISQDESAGVAPESFSIVLRDGSNLIGDLTGIDADKLTIKNARHGEVALKRSEVLRVVRLRGGKIIAAGPAGDAGWEIDEERSNGVQQPPVSVRAVAGAGGSLVFPYTTTRMLSQIKTPDRVEFDLTLRSSEMPAFLFSFESDEKDGIRLETWGDEIVIAHGDEFQPVRKIEKEEREIALCIRWDRAQKRVVVFNASGAQLAEMVFKEAPKDPRELHLKNKGRDLTLTHFCAREWNDAPPAKLDSIKPRAELANGTIVEGSVIELSGDSLKMSGTSESSHPLSEIAEIVFSNDAPVAQADAPTFYFTDGTLCHGRLVSIADGRATLETTFATAPLSVAMHGLRDLRLSKSAVDPADVPRDELQVNSQTLHGTLATSANSHVRWTPFGGVKPAMPKASADFKITRVLPPDAISKSAPALLYTSFGDILPIAFHGVADSAVNFESDLIEAKTFPVSGLDAVQFGNVTQANLSGFNAPGWRVVKGSDDSVKVTGDRVEIEPGSAFGHSLALQSDEFQFSFDPENCGAFSMKLFSSGMDSDRTTKFTIAPNGGMVYASLDDDGQFGGFNNTQVEAGKPAVVRVTIRNSTICLFIGERLMAQAESNPKRRGGSGLVLTPSDGFGNAMATVTLFDFSTKAAPGRTWMPDVSPETKMQALTVPRFRKERPPRQALVAMNGDVLRGEIEATTETHFGFISGLEKLKIPRSRVNAAIWLKPLQKDAPEKADPGVIAEMLEKPLRRNTSYSGLSLSATISILAREAGGIKITNHVKEEPKNRMFLNFFGQNLRSALDQICQNFSAHFRVERDGSITIESGPDLTKDFVEKVYVLKTDRLGDEKACETLLKEKGIAFPDGSSASWDSNARQFTVKHDPATQAKIAAILEKEFGANYVALTHWVQLANGARLGLAVEKFDGDFIIGRHPEYGVCRVPMPLVFSIQTSKPEATPVMRSLANWTLVAAREPVIEESGGDSAPEIGKDAAQFKIPILGGGDFDLQTERGKIVVLDFWATWCGPCIKSLPGLIEAIGAFPSDRVKLIGVNQGETADAVKRFLDARGWHLSVAMDADQKVAQQYGVNGIPHTVIVGPDGKIAWVKTGYSADGPAEAAKEITALLGKP